jgi:hypothetical protein
MKNKIIVVLLLVMLAVMLPCYFRSNSVQALPVIVDHPTGLGNELFTAIKPWALLRTPGVVDDVLASQLTIADMCYATMIDPNGTPDVAHGVIDCWQALGWGVNGVTIAFFTNSASDIENDVFDFSIWAYKDSLYGPALPVFLTTGNQCLVGTYVCLKHPTLGTTQASGKWVDTIAGTDCWPGGCTINDSGNNRLCTISFDLRGCRFVKVRIWAAAGATKAVAIGAIITGF